MQYMGWSTISTNDNRAKYPCVLMWQERIVQPVQSSRADTVQVRLALAFSYHDDRLSIRMPGGVISPIPSLRQSDKARTIQNNRVN